jgi:hypothetical protein
MLAVVASLSPAAPIWADSPQPAEIQRLIHQLGSLQFAQRRAASRRLADLGEPALEGLQQAATLSPDAEIRRRADALVRRIEQHIDPEVRRFAGHTDYVRGVAFAPGGKQVLSGSADGTVRLWDVASGKEVRRFGGHKGVVHSVALSPDGRRALSGGRDGVLRPIVVDEQGVIIVGHTRYKAALKLGLTEVPVHVARGLTPAQAKAYRIADNQTATLSQWDDDKLPLELVQLQQMDFDLDLTGFSADELAQLLAPAGTDGLTDPDDIPEPPDEPITQPGDLWQLGRHRLHCADSSKPEDVDRLLEGDRGGRRSGQDASGLAEEHSAPRQPPGCCPVRAGDRHQDAGVR